MPISVGERLSGLEATVGALQQYEHERWHKLDNDLSPLTLLPAQLARDLAKMEGRLESTLDRALEKELAPIIKDVADLKIDVASLKSKSQQMTGVRKFGEWLAQTVISAIVAIAAVMALGGRHP